MHVVNYHACRRATSHVEALEQPVPLHDVSLLVRGAGKARQAFLARSGTRIRMKRENGAIRVTVPRVNIHEMIVLE